MTPARALFTLVVSLALPLFAATTPPYLVKDLPGSVDGRDSLGTFWTTVGNTSWFTADAGDGLGLQLWKTDGTEAGTVRLTTSTAATGARIDTFIGAVNGSLLFGGRDFFGDVLFRLDQNGGTPELVARGHFADRGIHYQDALYFAGEARSDGGVAKGIELWRSDGTIEGTTFVDLNNGPASSLDSPTMFVAGDWIFFAGQTTAGKGIYRTDGTLAGTSRLVSDIGIAEPSQMQLTPFGDRALFVFSQAGVNNNQLLITDSTPDNEQTIVDRMSNFVPLGMLEGRMLFTIRTPGAGVSMWTTDGTVAGTRRLNDQTGPVGTIGLPGAAAGDKFFFFSVDPVTSKSSLYTTGALPGTTQKVIDVDLVRLGGVGWNGRFYFVSRNAAYGSEWWVSDGTPAGTHVVADLAAGSRDSAMPDLIMERPDGVLVGADGTFGREPYLLNEFGARLVKNIAPDTPQAGSNPDKLRAAGNRLFFLADAPGQRVVGRTENAIADVTTASIAPTDDWWNANTFTAGGRYYLQSGGSLLSTDGTAEGTERISFNAGTVLPMGSGVLFEEKSDNTFRYSDGTAAGTHVIQPYAGAPSAGWKLYSANERAWFTNGSILAVSDGFSPMQRVDVSIAPFVIREVVSGPDATYFVDARDDGTTRIWRTDGTAAGTRAVASFSAEVPSNFIVLGNKLLFALGNVMWSIDNGGQSVHNLSIPRVMSGCAGNVATILGNQLFWYVRNTNGTAALYKTDGTAAGTSTITTFSSSATGCTSMAALDGHVYFRNFDAEHGTEPWLTDGTAAGTRMLADLYPGPNGSNPQEFTTAGANLFFTADTPNLGRELWGIRQLGRRRAVGMP